jgi:hypothetical protein
MASELLDNIFICPISFEIFRNPKLAEDGHFYEDEYIKKWFNKKSVSPVTNLPIGTKLLRSYAFESLLKLYVDGNLNSVIKDDCLFDHLDYCDDVRLLFKKQLYNHIYKYKNFDVTKLSDGNMLKNFFVGASDETIKYFIDNVINLEEDIKGKKLIHLVVKYCNLNIITYLVSKGIDIECQTNNKWRPIHFAIKSAEENVLKFFVEKGADIECETNNGWRPIHLICHEDIPKNIKFFLTCKPQLDSKVYKYGDNENVVYGPKELIILNQILDSNEKAELILTIDALEKTRLRT